MVLDIPGGLFGQSDVRETATEEGIVTGTLYWSASGIDFKSRFQATDGDIGSTTGEFTNSNNAAVCPVHLPDGAIITAAVVYGDDAAEVWVLYRRTTAAAGAGTELATAAINTEDTSISNATIDNSSYCYFIQTSPLNTADDIYGAKIKYTL